MVVVTSILRMEFQKKLLLNRYRAYYSNKEQQLQKHPVIKNQNMLHHASNSAVSVRQCKKFKNDLKFLDAPIETSKEKKKQLA
ncbi:hypothetical protein DOY81_012117 [Sarcophaga bullata]|nr:hypothetical protein DOY81_012117 [Sarcophaga bullata]